MANAQSKILSSSEPGFIDTGSRHAITRTYPKRGQEQGPFDPGQGPWSDSPKGKAFTDTKPKRGQKMSIG